MKKIELSDVQKLYNGTKVYILFAKNNKKTCFFMESSSSLIEKVKSSDISFINSIFDAKTQQKQ